MGWLVRGSRGDNVEAVQGLLWQAGLYDGKIDGWYGPKTEKAVVDWQREAGALPDGKWGPKTIDSSAQLLGSFNDQAALAKGWPAVVPNYGRTLGQETSA